MLDLAIIMIYDPDKETIKFIHCRKNKFKKREEKKNFQDALNFLFTKPDSWITYFIEVAG